MKKFTALLMAIIMMFALSTVASAEEKVDVYEFDAEYLSSHIRLEVCEDYGLMIAYVEINDYNAEFWYMLANKMDMTDAVYNMSNDKYYLYFEAEKSCLVLIVDGDLAYDPPYIWEEGGLNPILDSCIEYTDHTMYVVGYKGGEIVFLPTFKK